MRQSSIFKLEGTVDDLTFYKSDGEFLAKKVTKVSKERILTAAEYKRMRENMQEFGGSALAGKSLRNSISESIKTMSDSRLTGRLTGKFRKIVSLDSGVRGERPINLSDHKEMLEKFELNRKTHFKTIFKGKYIIVNTPDRTSLTLTVDAFNPDYSLNVPEGATTFRFVCSIGAISNFQWNGTSQEYYPIDAINNEIGAIAFSDYFPVKTPVAAPIILTVTIPGTPVLAAEISVINCIGIEFFQTVDLTQYILASNNAMIIDKVI